MSSDDTATTLAAFQGWFFSPAGPGFSRIPLHEPVHHKDGITAITLYRHRGYQAELFILPPGQHYEILTPETMPFDLVFLGGFFEYGICPRPGMGRSGSVRSASPDDIRTGHVQAALNTSDPLDQLHPLWNVTWNVTKRPAHVLFAGNQYGTFQATEAEGLIMIFSVQATDRPHSLLEHIQTMATNDPLFEK